MANGSNPKTNKLIDVSIVFHGKFYHVPIGIDCGLQNGFSTGITHKKQKNFRCFPLRADITCETVPASATAG